MGIHGLAFVEAGVREDTVAPHSNLEDAFRGHSMARKQVPILITGKFTRGDESRRV